LYIKVFDVYPDAVFNVMVLSELFPPVLIKPNPHKNNKAVANAVDFNKYLIWVIVVTP